MITDPIADMFTRIRNAIAAGRKTVSIPASRMKKEITRILFENHFISKYAFINDGWQGEIKILLKYSRNLESAIQGIQRMSTPGRRQYRRCVRMPRVLNGAGVAIVSTSKGIVTDAECKKMGIGGEVLGIVW
jgi:small subunit ribosomal protein S8